MHTVLNKDVEWRWACAGFCQVVVFCWHFISTWEKASSKHTDMSTVRWLPVSLCFSLSPRTNDSPWNMISAGGAIEFRPHITCFADTYKIWNSTISKTCLHTHSPNPRLKHSHSLTIIPTPTLTPSPVTAEKLKLILPLQLVVLLLLLLLLLLLKLTAVAVVEVHTVWTNIIKGWVLQETD